MSVAIEIVNAVKTLIEDNKGSLRSGTLDVERQLVPQDYKAKLANPKIIVAWNGKDSSEQDRTGEAMTYRIMLGIYFPVNAVYSEAKQDEVVSLVEKVSDLLANRDNRHLTLTTGVARLVLPFTTDQIYDPLEIKQTSNFFSVMQFNYRYYQGR